jgi:hypothetical protein
VSTDPCEWCAYYAALEHAETRSLAAITTDALRATCGDGDCWAAPGQPCSITPYVHLARYQRARRKGLISAADLTAVLAAVIESMIPFTGVPA